MGAVAWRIAMADFSRLAEFDPKRELISLGSGHWSGSGLLTVLTNGLLFHTMQAACKEDANCLADKPWGGIVKTIALSLRTSLLILSGLVATSVSAASYDNLYVFGDSASDTGARLFFQGIPTAPYWNGRHSNGAVAVEYLSASLGITLTPGVNNFAVGGALTGLYNVDTSPSVYNTGMLNQLSYYSNLVGGQADPNALYFIWGGGNDLAACGNGLCTQAQLQPSIDNINSLITELSADGARHFFVVNQWGTNAGATMFNNMLAADMQSLTASGVDITYFDTRPVVAGMNAANNPYGFTHRLNDPCYTGDLAGNNGTICDTPFDYVRWDTKLHLTAHANQILGDAMAAAVPEPETYAMLLAGLGLVGTIARRRKLAAV